MTKLSKKPEDYKFGIITRLFTHQWRAIGICNCGQVILKPSHKVGKNQCEKCGNTLFIDTRNQSHKNFSVPYLEIIKKDNKGFHVIRRNLSISLDKENTTIVPVKENLTRSMEYDIVEKKLIIKRKNEIEYDYQNREKFEEKWYFRRELNTKFFTQLDTDLFLDFVSNEVTRNLFTKCATMRVWNAGAKDNIIQGLINLMTDYSFLQILANAGIPNVDRFYSIEHGNKTKPHEILNVPKFMINYIKQDNSISEYNLRQLRSSVKKIDSNKAKEIFSIAKDEATLTDLSKCIDMIMQVHIDYDYTNLKKLVLYIFRETRLYQGITSPSKVITLLRDYIRMSRNLGLEYEKYPKSLVKEHDIVTMNYNFLNNSLEKKDLFKKSLDKNSYKNLAYTYKKSKYSILVPDEPEELVKEGNELSHCVASYIDDIINDKCKILFLRDNEEVEKPLVTIEVRGINIRQARGFGNKAINEEQKSFIEKWADEKGLVEAYY